MTININNLLVNIVKKTMNTLNRYLFWYSINLFFLLACGILIDLSEPIENSPLKPAHSKSPPLREESRKSPDATDIQRKSEDSQDSLAGQLSQ